MITPANCGPIYGAIATKVEEFRGIVHALNGMPDHVHLVATVPSSHSLARFIGEVKGASSHLASRLDRAEGSLVFAWQADYAAITISESHLPIVMRYVQRQQQHHAHNTLNHTLEGYEIAR
jgi:putative transposase